MCPHDFDAFGGPVAWIENVTAECREKLAPLFQLTAGNALTSSSRLILFRLRRLRFFSFV
jgi:hypothetical protein